MSLVLLDQEVGSVEDQEVTTRSVKKQEQEAGAKEQEAGAKEQEEQTAGLGASEVPSEAPGAGMEEKMRKNLEMFENTMKHPNAANNLILYDNLPERRVSYRLLYEGLKVDVKSLNNVIDLGTKDIMDIPWKGLLKGEQMRISI